MSVRTDAASSGSAVWQPSCSATPDCGMLWSCLLLCYREMAPAAPGAVFNMSEEKSRALRLNLYVRTDDLAGPPLFEVITTATSRA